MIPAITIRAMVACRIDGHLRSVFPESVREKILTVSRLLTSSQRIGASSYIPGTRQGQYCKELESALKRCKQKQDTVSWEPPTKRARLNKDQKWKVVSDMLPWIHTPLGRCPGQELSSSFLDLPTTVNKQKASKSELTD